MIITITATFFGIMGIILNTVIFWQKDKKIYSRSNYLPI